MGSKYTKNDNYFAEPTIDNCYWAGFIAADGNISGNKTTKLNSLTILLKRTDRIILERFKEAINYTGSIKDYTIKPYTYIKTGYTIPEKYSSRLQISNAYTLISDLGKNFYIGPKKSLTLLPPPIANIDQIKAYIVGYFDGDGSLLWSTTLEINVLGTYELLSWMKIILEDLTTEHYTLLHLKHSGNTWRLAKKGSGVLKFHEALMTVNVTRLERKWNLAEVERLGRLRKEANVQNTY